MWNTPSLPSLPDPLWLGMVVPVMVQSIDQIALFNHLIVRKNLIIDIT